MSRLFNIHFPLFFAVTFVTTATFMGFALYLTDHVWLFPVIPLVLLTTSGFGIIAGSLLGYFLGSIGFLLIILLVSFMDFIFRSNLSQKCLNYEPDKFTYAVIGKVIIIGFICGFIYGLTTLADLFNKSKDLSSFIIFTIPPESSLLISFIIWIILIVESVFIIKIARTARRNLIDNLFDESSAVISLILIGGLGISLGVGIWSVIYN